MTKSSRWALSVTDQVTWAGMKSAERTKSEAAVMKSELRELQSLIDVCLYEHYMTWNSTQLKTHNSELYALPLHIYICDYLFD